MARYNSSSGNTTINGATSIASPYSGAFTEFTGTAPYTVTLPAPTLYPGSTQTFYNATAGNVTISTPSGLFAGLGASGASTTVMSTNTVTTVTSDGTNYIVLSEDGSALVATTGSFTGNVDMSGASSTVNINASTVNINPSSGTMNNVTIGGTNRGAGSFLGLNANGQVNFTSNTASSSTTTGTLVVTGGMGVSGTVYASGVNATNLTGTLQTAAQTNITSVGTLGSITTTGAATANNGFASKQWTASCTSGNHIYLMSFGAGAYGSSMSGTLWIRSTFSGAVTQARYSITSFGSQNATSGSSVLSYDIYGGAPANFQVYDMGQGTLGAGSALISLMNTSGSTCTYDFTYIADSGSGIPTFYATPSVNSGTPTGNIIKFGNQNINLQTAKITETSGGFVGINASNPLEVLQVGGAIRSTSNAQNFSGTAGAIFDYYSNTMRFAVYDGTNLGTMGLTSGSNLGVGTTSPSARLQVTSDVTGDGILLDILSNPTITLRDRGNSDTKIGTGSNAGLDNFYINTYNVNNALMINGATGNVGINRNDPSYKLDVSGSLRSAYSFRNYVKSHSSTNASTGGYQTSTNITQISDAMYEYGFYFGADTGGYPTCPYSYWVVCPVQKQNTGDLAWAEVTIRGVHRGMWGTGYDDYASIVVGSGSDGGGIWVKEWKNGDANNGSNRIRVGWMNYDGVYNEGTNYNSGYNLGSWTGNNIGQSYYKMPLLLKIYTNCGADKQYYITVRTTNPDVLGPPFKGPLVVTPNTAPTSAMYW